uniref:Immunoglobulin domain-containing protein n=1 Tax=Xiphophorus maculatus TaxID=8083 RepID=A0A3B5R232_XIPMA
MTSFSFTLHCFFNLMSDRCCDPVNKTQSIEEGSVTISCPYDSQSVNKLKFLCRGNRPSTCRQQAVITSNNTQNGRFRLSDDRKSRIFTVTISSLTLNDSGSYLCGVQRNSGSDDFSAVELEVKALYWLFAALPVLLLILIIILVKVCKPKRRQLKGELSVFAFNKGKCAYKCIYFNLLCFS